MRVSRRLLCVAAEVATKADKQSPAKTCGLFSRLRSFTGGFILASSASFSLLYFPLQAVNDELRLAVAEVKQRQEALERKIGSE